MNQIGSLQRAGDTRWGSHLRSISSLLKMFSAACTVLLSIIDEGTNYDQRAEADSAYTSLTSFEFVFILHLMKEIMEVTDMLSQALQRKSQDILNDMHLVKTTKSLIKKLRDDGCDVLFVKVKSFCESRAIDIPDMNALYVERGGRARNQQNHITIKDHYRINMFTATIDSQLQELNNRFSEHAVKLILLSSTLDPHNARLSFKINDVCQLVDEFYPKDFTEYERSSLKVQLQHYELDVLQHPKFQSLCTISDLCQWMAKSRKSLVYPLIDRVIRLILTLPVSTATTERAFSAMSIVKSELRNKMEDEFLTNSLTIFIERDIASQITTESIIDGFRDLKERRVQF